jgi:hypothetical protein
LKDGYSAHPKGFPAVRDFCEWAKVHRVRVIATFPNIASNQAYKPEMLAQTERRLRDFYQTLDVPVVGSMEQATFPQSDCYDTLYHLVDDAVSKRTIALVDLLKPALKTEQQPE